MLAAVVGGSATLLGTRLWLGQWADGGVRYEVGVHGRITIPEGALESLVYYESDDAVASHHLRIYLRSVNEQTTDPAKVQEIHINKEAHTFSIGRHQGRAFARLALDAPGEYEFVCFNGNYGPGEIPESDRVVFMKSPGTLAEVKNVRRLLLTIGGSVTVFSTLILYGIHYVVLSARHRREEDEEPESLVPA